MVESGEHDGGPEPVARAFEWRQVFTSWTRRVFIATAVVTASLLFLSAYDIRPFAMVDAIFLPAFIVVGAIHGLALAVVLAEVIEMVWPDLTDIHEGGHVLIGAAILVLVPAVAYFDWWVWSQDMGPWVKVLYLGSAIVGLLVTTVLTALTWSPTLFPDEEARRPVYILAGIAGIVFVTLLTGLLLVGDAFYRNVTQTAAVTQPAAVDLGSLHLAPEPGQTIGDLVGPEYVALGDSYSAGEGLRRFLPETADHDVQLNMGDECHRSGQAYSEWLDHALGLPPLRFVACSGAVTIDLTKGYQVGKGDEPQLTVAPQLGDSPHPEVGLVTMTLGGNDELFSQIVRYCLLQDECMDSKFEPDWPHRRTQDFPEDQHLEEWAKQDARNLRPKISEVYHNIRANYPNARVVVIGYPYLLPKGGGGVHLNDCDSILRRFSENERDRLRTLQDTFNDMLYEEAVEAKIEFVSTQVIWNGHEPCGSDGQYTNSLKPIFATGLLDGGSFHPNLAGQAAFARLVACYLNDTKDGPPDPYVGGDSSPFADDVLLPAGDVGLKPAPGTMSNPVPCCAS